MTIEEAIKFLKKEWQEIQSRQSALNERAAALEALRLQFPLFDIQSLLVTAKHLPWPSASKPVSVTIRSSALAVVARSNWSRSGSQSAATSG